MAAYHLPYTPSTAKENFLRNQRPIYRAKGVREFRQARPGEPAVVVGAGPSLGGAFPALRYFRDAGGLVIAVDRAVHRLLESNVEPQFVVTQDNGETTGRFFAKTIPGATLVFHQCADPNYVLRWTGALATATLHGGRSGLGALDWGRHVGHASVAFAHLMGCRPIILVGVDLAFKPDETHVDGTVDENVRRTTRIPSVTGEEVDSDETFLAATIEYARFIRDTRARLIQTSPFGARIEGAEEWELRGILKEVMGEKR